ncbi:uncharacterized protein FA14DRAFT_84866 [Meira miltonrushii]|uniref:PH domain-containing protein n=1 Tax=Meira miltonrushii TaxID=1280837 RepID=A0A316V9D8_9BASI|nr:uncharacterized protein FA14DRAFT_84866 [Meira miltonrushii]PWN32095.1 hypothetical protein FA14DRAFT_84866 [Meira miltonrushii]
MVLSVEGLPTIEGFLSLPDSGINNSSTDSNQYLSQCSSWTTRWCILLNGALHVYAKRVHANEMSMPRAMNIIPLTTYQQLKVSGDYENSEWDLTLSGTLPKINIATPTPSGSMDNCAASPSTSKTLPRSATSGSLSAMFMRFGSGSTPSKSPKHDQRSYSPSEDTLNTTSTSTASPSSCRPVSRGSSVTSFAPSSFNRHASLFNTTGSRNGSRRNSGSNGTLSPVVQSNDEIPEKRTWGRLSSRSRKLYNFVTSGLPSSSSNLAAELRRESGNQQQPLPSPTSPCSPTSQFWSRSSLQSFSSSRSPSIAQQEDPAQFLTLRAPDATSMVRWAEAISTSLNNETPVIPKDPSLSQPIRPSTSRSRRTPLTEVAETFSSTVRPTIQGRRSLSSGSIFAIMAPSSNQEIETLKDRKSPTSPRSDFSVRAARSSADLLSSSRDNSSSSPTSYSFARQASSSPSEPRYSTSTNTTMASPPMVERILPPEEIIATIDRLRSERANNTQGLGLTGIQMDSHNTSIYRSEQKTLKTSKSAMGHLNSRQSRPSTSPAFSDAGFMPPSFNSTNRISEDQQSFTSHRGANMEAASAAAIAIISKQTAESEIGSPQLLRENIAESPSMVSRSLPVPPRKSRSFLALDQKRESDLPRLMRTHSPKKEMRVKTELTDEKSNEQFSLPPSSSDLLRKSDGLDSPSSPTNTNVLRENNESSKNTPKNTTNNNNNGTTTNNKKSYNLAKSAKMQKRISRSLELGNEDFITRSSTNKENMVVII